MPPPDDVADVPHDFGRLHFLASESYVPIERTLFNLQQRITAAGMSALGDGLPHHRHARRGGSPVVLFELGKS